MFTSKIASFLRYLSKINNKMQAPKQSCNSFTTPSGNQVWAPAMQLAWNELRQKFTNGQPIGLAIQDQHGLQTMNVFNQATFQAKDINPNSIYVKSGYGPATLAQINSEVKNKFPQKSLPPIQVILHQTDIICYAYLFKQLSFAAKFERRLKASFKFRGKNVNSFYAQTEAQKKQVLVHSYSDQDRFMVQIKGKDGNDSLFLIKNEGIKTTEEAIKLTNQGLSKYPEKLQRTDYFQMPIVNLDIKKDFTELIGAQFLNEELKQYFIRVMFEGIKINIDESGAKVQNQAVIAMTRGMAPMTEKKTIILDKSFWVVMKETGKPAYLSAFINEPSEIVK